MAKTKNIKTVVTRQELTELVDSIGDLQCQAKPTKREENRVKKIVASIARGAVEGKVNMSNISGVSLLLCTTKNTTQVAFTLKQGEVEQKIKLTLTVAA